MKPSTILKLLVLFAFLVAGCFYEPYPQEGWATKAITQEYFFPSRGADGKPTVEGDYWSVKDLNLGRHSYMHYCYACHGVDGDGKGPASYGFRPPPRDFRKVAFKFGAVRSGEKPSDDDLVRIVLGGLHGTPMLEWDIPEPQLRRIIAFIKTFPPAPCDPEVDGKEKCDKEAAEFPDGKPNKWQDRYTRGKRKGLFKPIGEAIVVPKKDPWAGKSQEAIAKGAEVYHLKAQCATCHPSYMTRQELSDLSEVVDGKPLTSFREGMYQGIVLAAKDNPYKVNLMPPDFTLSPLRSIRKGKDLRDLWRLIASGVGGVMPAWVDGLKPDEIWALSHYIKSLVDLSRTENRAKMTALHKKLATQPPFRAPPPTPTQPKPTKITLAIAADGKVKIGDDGFDNDEKLQDKLSELVAAGPMEVKIEADKKTKKERVIEIAKLVGEVGIKKIDLPTGIEISAEEEDGGEEDKPEIPIAGDVKDPKGLTKAPPTPVPPVQPPSGGVPKVPKGKPPAPKAPAPKAPAPKAPPSYDPYDI
jgi:mono/diheme cytochrome c family protein